jgi:hypothetical protein
MKFILFSRSSNVTIFLCLVCSFDMAVMSVRIFKWITPLNYISSKERYLVKLSAMCYAEHQCLLTELLSLSVWAVASIEGSFNSLCDLDRKFRYICWYVGHISDTTKTLVWSVKWEAYIVLVGAFEYMNLEQPKQWSKRLLWCYSMNWSSTFF